MPHSPALTGLLTWAEALAAEGALVPASRVVDRIRDVLVELPPMERADSVLEDRDLSSSEAGLALGRSDSTVRAWCRDGRLPGAYRQSGREWRIPRSAIDAFRAAQRVENSRPAPTPAPTPRGRRSGGADLSAWRSEINKKCA